MIGANILQEGSMHIMTELLKDKGKRVLLLTQCILMAAAVLYWLANRGNAFHKTFAPEEFLVRENTLVAQDVTTDEARSTGGGRHFRDQRGIQKDAVLCVSAVPAAFSRLSVPARILRLQWHAAGKLSGKLQRRNPCVFPGAPVLENCGTHFPDHGAGQPIRPAPLPQEKQMP